MGSSNGINGNVIYVDGHDWIDYVKKLEQSAKITAQTADKALGNIGAAGRRVLTERERKVFHLGEMQTKGNQRKVFSKYDSSMGGFVSTETVYRLAGFTFEKAAWSAENNRSFNAKRVKMYSSISAGHIYSRISNLWDKPTKPYSGRSPLVGRDKNTLRTWAKGKPRPASIAINKDGTRVSSKVWDTADIQPVVESAMNKAGQEMLARLKREFGDV